MPAALRESMTVGKTWLAGGDLAGSVPEPHSLSSISRLTLGYINTEMSECLLWQLALSILIKKAHFQENELPQKQEFDQKTFELKPVLNL